MDEIDKYILEQAKIEIEHTRSWPTKVLAFYVAINVGITTSLIAYIKIYATTVHLTALAKGVIILAIAGLLLWSFYLIRKNHKSYLKHRNLQIKFQRTIKDEAKKRYDVSDEWFLENEVSMCVRSAGWSFYFYIMLIVASFSICGILAL